MEHPIMIMKRGQSQIWDRSCVFTHLLYMWHVKKRGAKFHSVLCQVQTLLYVNPDPLNQGWEKLFCLKIWICCIIAGLPTFSMTRVWLLISNYNYISHHFTFDWTHENIYSAWDWTHDILMCTFKWSKELKKFVEIHMLACCSAWFSGIFEYF